MYRTARPDPARTVRNLAAVLCALAVLGCSGEAVIDGSAGPTIDRGSHIDLEYTLTLRDGTEIETNVGDEPLRVQIGAEEILTAVEDALIGLGVESTTSVEVPPDLAYGSVDPEAFERLPLDQIPPDARVVGQRLIATDDAGNQQPVRVAEVHTDAVVLDLNHPLAGEALRFDLRVLSIE